jgi:hypothetical protein
MLGAAKEGTPGARPYIVSIKTARLSLGVVPGPHCRLRFTPARPLSPGFAPGDHSPSRDMPRRLLTPVMRKVLGADLHVTAEGIAKFASSALVPTGCLPGCVISASIMPLSRNVRRGTTAAQRAIRPVLEADVV